MASRQFAAKSRALAARTVHLKLYPPPRNINDQREVLRVLEKFGEVTIFKSLKYRTSAPSNQTFLATFATERAAEEVVALTPLKYHLVADTQSIHEGHPTTAEESSTSNSRSTGDDMTHMRPHEFELHAKPSTLSHETYITSPHTNPLYGPYNPSSVKRSYVTNMLDNAVTTGMWSSGLKDWETDVERWSKNGAYEHNTKTANEQRDGHRLSGKILGKVGDSKTGLAAGHEAQKGMTERAVYTRAVNRRKKEIPDIMWGVKRFIDMHKTEAGRRKDKSVD